MNIFLTEPSISENVFLEMVESYIAHQLKDFQPWIFLLQQDEPSPQLDLDVSHFLSVNFPNRMIGRDGRKPWSPPDITPLDFFRWGGGGWEKDTKGRIFSSQAPDTETLTARITDALVVMTKEMLRYTRQEIENRLHVLRVASGALVDVRKFKQILR